jgi:AcrR family transcriptional regulator
MDTIASSADVSKRTIYKHFINKYNLFAAVVRLLCEETIAPPIDAIGASNESPEQVLADLGIHFLTSFYSSEQIKLFRLVVSDSHRVPELGKMMLDQAVDKTEELISEYLLQQQELGAMHLPSPEIAASQFLGLLKTNLQMKLLFGQRKHVSEEEIRQTVQSCVEIFMNGVGRTQPVPT